MSIKIEKTNLWGWDGAIRGMRNPMNSWDKSDSDELVTEKDGIVYHKFIIGENDMKLMKTLIRGGGDERKFLRMIHVQVDVTAPLYWWKEFDTYKIGTVANSCSTMHKIQSKEFTLDDFSHDHLLGLTESAMQLVDTKDVDTGIFVTPKSLLEITISILNKYRELFNETKIKTFWWQMIQLLPSSYNQKRTLDLNYEVLMRLYPKRKNHKLDEWHIFCDWIESLPYMKEFLGAMN